MAFVAPQPLVHDDAGDLTAFAGAGAVAEEEPTAAGGAFGVEFDIVRFWVEDVGAGEVIFEALAGIDDGFQLRIGEIVRCCFRQERTVGRRGRKDGCHGSGFDESSRMFACVFEVHARDAVGNIETIGVFCCQWCRAGAVREFDRARAGCPFRHYRSNWFGAPGVREDAGGPYGDGRFLDGDDSAQAFARREVLNEADGLVHGRDGRRDWFTGNLVDDHEADGSRGAVLGIIAGVERHVGPDCTDRGNCGVGGRIFAGGAEPTRHDRDGAPARPQRLYSGEQVARGSKRVDDGAAGPGERGVEDGDCRGVGGKLDADAIDRLDVRGGEGEGK